MIDAATGRTSYFLQLQKPFLPVLFQQLRMLILPFCWKGSVQGKFMPHNLQLSALGNLSRLNEVPL